jgi:hypothetical protein
VQWVAGNANWDDASILATMSSRSTNLFEGILVALQDQQLMMFSTASMAAEQMVVAGGALLLGAIRCAHRQPSHGVFYPRLSKVLRCCLQSLQYELGYREYRSPAWQTMVQGRQALISDCRMW